MVQGQKLLRIGVGRSKEADGCAYFAMVSLAASLLGSVMAAAVVSIAERGEVQTIPVLFVGVLFFGIWIAVPVGMLLGIPMLAVTRRLLPRHTVSGTLAFAITGLLGGLALQRLDGANGFGNAFLVFGACVGGMHPLLYSRLNGERWRSIGAALLLSAVLVPSAAHAGESVHNMIDSQDEFEARCAETYENMAFVADRAALERDSGSVRPGQGKWYNQRKWRSLYAWERWVPLDGTRMLIARDYAFVPSGFAGWITGGRRVERHCLSEKKGGTSALLRRYGFGNRPALRDLED